MNDCTRLQDVRHPFPPLFDANSRFLFLGTMPSPASRERGFFYMHSQNRFWRVIAALFGESLAFSNADGEDAIRERKTLALRHGIALWDVLQTCRIDGASDASIRDARPNDFSAVLSVAKIEKILCTGKTAFALYERLCFPLTSRHAVCLPSTSSANAAWSLDRLCGAYSAELR